MDSLNIGAMASVLIFLLSYSCSPGPFWMRWMQYHLQEDSIKIYKIYMIFLVFVNGPQIFIVSYLVQWLGSLDQNIFLFLYFIGGSFIVYLGLKSFLYQIIKTESNKYSFWQMSFLGLTNPKFYTTLPAGAMEAVKISSSLVFNSIVFTLIAICCFLLGSVFFMLITKLGKRTSVKAVTIITSSMLIGYGLYLIYEGFKIIYLS